MSCHKCIMPSQYDYTNRKHTEVQNHHPAFTWDAAEHVVNTNAKPKKPNFERIQPKKSHPLFRPPSRAMKVSCLSTLAQ